MHQQIRVLLDTKVQQVTCGLVLFYILSFFQLIYALANYAQSFLYYTMPAIPGTLQLLCSGVGCIILTFMLNYVNLCPLNQSMCLEIKQHSGW